ncbi:MAG: FHA domain-containing protein, partial [Demequina sp.]
TPVELALPDEPTPASAVSQAAMEDPPTAAHARDGANAVAPGGVDPRPLPVDLASLMASEPSPLWTLTLPDGNELFAAPLIVVGRRPWRSDPAETQTYYVKAPSPHREISSKHVEFTVSGGQLRARDLNSTNGTVVESQGRAPRLLRDGQDTALAVGDVLDLGEGFRIVVGSKRGVDHMAVLAPPNVVHNMAWPKTD